MKKNETNPGKPDTAIKDKTSGGAQSQLRQGKTPTGTPHPKEGKSTDRELQSNKGTK